MSRVRRLFLAAAALLYVGFLVLDLTRAADSAPLKFAAISLCFAAALPGARTADGRLTALALAFAVCADRFLLAPDGRYLLGVSLFCIVQALYCVRLARWRGGIRRCMLALRLLPLAAFLFAQDALPALVLLYFVNLVCSAARGHMLPPGQTGRPACLRWGSRCLSAATSVSARSTSAFGRALPAWGCGCSTCPPRYWSSCPLTPKEFDP